jgi:hypothetical protein
MMPSRIALRSALLLVLAMALTGVPVGAALNVAPATTVRIAKISVPGEPLRAFDISCDRIPDERLAGWIRSLVWRG